MANIAYKWNTGSPSINVNVSNMASDNSGVTKLELVNVSGGVTFSYSSGSSSAPGQPSYTSTFLVSASSLPNGYAMSTFTTKVKWKSGGSTPNGTTQTAYLCQPATDMSVNLGKTRVWSTDTTPISVKRTFVGASGTVAWGKDNGKVTFSSSDTNFVTVGTSTATTSTQATLKDLSSKNINKETIITINGVSTSGVAPDSNKTIAGPTALQGDESIIIMNATKSLGLRVTDTHLYKDASTTAYVDSTPHANGAGSVVYSNALTSISSDKPAAVTVGVTSLGTTNSNTNSFNITGKGGGIATITVKSNVNTVGKDVNASAQVTCSSLPQKTDKYTYTGGTGAFDISYDSITSNSASAYATASTTASNSSAGKFTYNGVKSGYTTITMASGATVKITCSNLNNTQTTYTYTGGKGTMSISYDKVNLISAPDSVSRATLDGSISQTTANVTATYTGKGSGTTTFDMASGAKILITCSSLSATKTLYTYSGGQGSYAVYNDEISGTSSWATLSNNSLAYNGFTGGQTGTVSMRSGATVSVVCSNLPATTQRVVYSKKDSGTTTEVTFSNDILIDATGATTYMSYTASESSVTVTAHQGVTETKTLTLNMRSGAKIVVTCYHATVDDTQVELNVGDRKDVKIGANDSIVSGASSDYYTASKDGSKLTIFARSIGAHGQIELASGLIIKVTVTDITVDIS